MTLIVWLLSIFLAIAGNPTQAVENAHCKIDNVQRAIMITDHVSLFQFSGYDDPVLAAGCHGWVITDKGAFYIDW